ncbi:hypothetical protein J7E87_15175 [Streptomyces sp. ISL-1]|uniref:hypothetical protein n=1 Tax=Streptomyces sp. ISL-1 TaxID=2817657 RepID=UPI001BEA42F3|nr:hypothetical protein [Streptomyces sp. ISL-1]MBT2390732.1 hypothetical protein [Streptomyces sp. ISL-1]
MKVDNKELNAELKKVRGKEGMLLRVAEAALAQPSGTVRRVIFTDGRWGERSRRWRRRSRDEAAISPGSAPVRITTGSAS